MNSLRSGPGKRGFTLIELMVGIAILAVLLVILLQITSSVLQSTRLANQKMNASRTARSILDAVGSDLDQLVNQRGLSVFIRPSAVGAVTNADLALLTQGRSARSASPVRFADVQYHISNRTLDRSVGGVAWTNAALVQAISSNSSAATSELGSGVLRLVAVAVLDDGSLVPLTSGSNTWSSDTVDGIAIPENYRALRLKSPLNTNAGARSVRALVIAVATLDEQILPLLGDGGASLASALVDPQVGETPVEVWERLIRTGALGGFPRPALATLQFTQQTYELK